MYEIHEAFEAQKDEFKKQEEEFKRKEDDLRDQDQNIQAQLINYCKFLQDNEAKKNRAEKRLQEETKQRDQKDKDIKEVQGQYEELQNQQQKLEAKVQALKKYEEYLDSVIKAHSDQYQDLAEISNRYKTLSTSNQNLQNEHKQLEKEQEETKHQIQVFQKYKNQEILQLNNDIKELTKKLEEKNNEKMQLQSLVEDSNKKSSDKNLNLGRILMAVDNLYNRCMEGMNKIKTDFEENQRNIGEKANIKEKKTEKKVERDKKKTGKDKYDGNEDIEDNYEEKSKKAISKLKIIKSYMSDFKTIIAECKKESEAAKNIKFCKNQFLKFYQKSKKISKQMNFFNLLNKRLDEGWKLTDSNCPICKSSIIYNPKDKSLFCIKCDKPCKIEGDIIDNQEQESKSTKESQAATSNKQKDLNDDSDSDFDEYEFKWNMNKNAPPSRTDEISKLLSQKLLQGYAMLQECCAVCLAPIMKSKAGEYTCVGCKWVRTKKEFDEIVQAQLNGVQYQEKPKQQVNQQQQSKPQEVKQQTTVVENYKVEQIPQVQSQQSIQDSGEKQKFQGTLQRILNKTADFYEKQIDLYTQQGQIAVVDKIIKTSLKELIEIQKQLEKQ
ncbi:hypothetical protein ABPG72_010452 [Tetrahymena utriculariae]